MGDGMNKNVRLHIINTTHNSKFDHEKPVKYTVWHSLIYLIGMLACCGAAIFSLWCFIMLLFTLTGDLG